MTMILRDAAEARQFLLQGLWWQRVLKPTATTVRPVLEWYKELASAGHLLPSAGFLADLGHVVFGEDWENRSNRDTLEVPHLPMNLIRTYEDHVLGKIYADWTFGRACDALRRYAPGREKAQGLAFLVAQFQQRANFPGVIFTPGVINSVLDLPPEEILMEGFESLRETETHPLLEKLYQGLIEACRRTPEILGPEDLFELESRTALEEVGQRVARQQVLRMASSFEATLPRHRIRPLAQRMEVPTRILDEDTYPVGGFTSISNRGSVESLLHSQLAYMENDGEGPDLFDIKFLRDELLYYSRDENQFLRRRRTFVIVLPSNLVDLRFKDNELPYQRIILLLALIYVVLQKLSEWLSSDALVFHLLFLENENDIKLKDERDLLETLLSEPIQTGEVKVDRIASVAQINQRCSEWARKSMVHCLCLSATPLLYTSIEPEQTIVTRLQIQSAQPQLADGCDAQQPFQMFEGDDVLEKWAAALQAILQRWI